MLVGRYRERPITTEISMEAVTFKFPDLYICSDFPNAYSNKLHKKSLWPPDSTDARLKQNHKNLFKELMKHPKLRRFADVFAWRAIWATHPRLAIQDKYQMIIKAKLSNMKSALTLSSFKVVPSVFYHMCFKFMNVTYLRSYYDELTLYLYADISHLKSVDTEAESGSRMFSGKIVSDKSSGLKFFFAERGFYPSTASSLTTSCGMHTDVAVSMTERMLLNREKHECQNEHSTLKIFNHVGNNDNITYKQDFFICRIYQWAVHIHQKCRCVPLQFPIPAYLAKDTRRCLDLRRWSFKDAMKNIRCQIQARMNKTLRYEIKKTCKVPKRCRRLEYSLQRSSVVWPARSLMKKFVSNVINTTCWHRQKNHSVAAWKNVVDAPNATVRSTMVRENVMKVVIHPQSSHSTLIVETEAYPIISLLSDIGGILGLYLGMSVLSLCELLESFSAIFLFVKMTVLNKRARSQMTELSLPDTVQ